MKISSYIWIFLSQLFHNLDPLLSYKENINQLYFTFSSLLISLKSRKNILIYHKCGLLKVVSLQLKSLQVGLFETSLTTELCLKAFKDTKKLK